MNRLTISNVCSLILGATLGALVMWGNQPLLEKNQDELNGNLRALVLEVEKLNGGAEGIRDVISNSSLNSGVASRRIEPQGPLVKELAARLANLESNYQELLNTWNGDRQRPSAHFRSILQDPTISYPQKTSVLVDLRERSEIELAVGYLGWTYLDILQELGSPTSVRNKGGTVLFDYEELPHGGLVQITFEEQHVVEFEAFWDS